ncbi:LCP family protein [Vagococcus sp. BWB3-3]|uniref:LCP family protein n=1 Tax=Vagococcus allomyrinae TaxID=2794353 RepID=A0A940PFK0_9ENTE|nr:LCP family protein [Vagococcus allomyrinae]MBP1043682.1 LCP family protein [Vagococcus allomyrinae]
MSKKETRYRKDKNRKKHKSEDENYESRSSRNKPSVWVNVFKVSLVVLLIAVLGAVAYGAKLLTQAEDLMEQTYKPRKSGTDSNETIEPNKTPFSILVMGVDDNDERALGSNRTDTMIVVTMNPDTGKVSMVSIPRDTFTYVESDDFTGYTKINAAYTYGKEDGAIDAVEGLLDIPIDFYVTVDFQAFEKIVDALGGVSVDVPVAISEANAQLTRMVELEPGEQVLTGEEALAFARTRKIDNDIKRGERQQMVVQAVMKKAMAVGSITKYSDVMASLNNHLWTDMNRDTMMKVAQSALTNDFSFESFTFSWMSFTYSYTGESMVGLHEDSLEYIKHKLLVSLGKEAEDERDKPGYVFETDGIVSEQTYPPYGDGAVDD